jgi:hypothetical protein
LGSFLGSFLDSYLGSFLDSFLGSYLGYQAFHQHQVAMKVHFCNSFDQEIRKVFRYFRKAFHQEFRKAVRTSAMVETCSQVHFRKAFHQELCKAIYVAVRTSDMVALVGAVHTSAMQAFRQALLFEPQLCQN